MKLEILSIAHHANSTGGAPFDIVEFSNDDICRIGILFEAEGHCAILDDTKIFEGDFAFDSNSYHGKPIEPHLRNAIAEFRAVNEPPQHDHIQPEVLIPTTKQPTLEKKVAKALLNQWLADDRRLIGGNQAHAALRAVATHLNVSLDALENGDDLLKDPAS
jgi:hypothetical protein